MSTEINTAELRELWHKSEDDSCFGLEWADARNAMHAKFLAVLDSLDSAMAEAGRLREAIDPIARAYRVSMEPFAPGIDEADGAHHWMPHGWPSVKEFKNANSALTSTPTTAAWLEARDRRMKLIGAAEELERLAKENEPWPIQCHELKQRAANLRQEASHGRND
jgi:hypothetical protein